MSGKGETGYDPGSCHQSFEEFRVTGVGLFLTIPWCIPEACKKGWKWIGLQVMGCEQRNSLCRLIELSNQGRVQQKAPPWFCQGGGR